MVIDNFKILEKVSGEFLKSRSCSFVSFTNHLLFFSLPIENISCIVVAGGTKESSTKGSSSVEVLIGDHGTIQLQNLPKIIRVPSMFPQNRSISLVGGVSIHGNVSNCSMALGRSKVL